MEPQKQKLISTQKPSRLLSDREIDWNLEAGIKIGEGTYGVVYKFENINFKVYDRDTKTTKTYKNIAVKYSNMNNDEIDRETLSELGFLTAIHHPNIMSLLDVYIYKNQLGIVLPLAQTTLHEVISHNRFSKDRKITQQDNWDIIYQILRGCYALQSVNILHGDYKPGNYLVFIEDTCIRVVLSDFGISTYTECLENNSNYVSFTPGYRPPELIFEASRYTTKGDTWSLGCIFYELITRQPLFYNPYSENTDKEIVEAIVNKLGVPNYENDNTILMEYAERVNQKKKPHVLDMHSYLNKTISKEYISIIPLLLKMLVLDPDERISIEDVLGDIIEEKPYIPPQLIDAFKRIEGMKCQTADIEFKSCMVRLIDRQFLYSRIVLPIDDRFDILLLLYSFSPPLPNDVVMKTVTIFDIFCFRYLKDGNKINDKELIDYLGASLHIASVDHHYYTLDDLLENKNINVHNKKQKLLIKVLQVLSYLQFDITRTTSYDLLFYMCKKYNDSTFTNTAIDYLFVMSFTKLAGMYTPRDIAKTCINLAGRYVGFKEIAYPETNIVTIETRFANELITEPLKTKLMEIDEDTFSLLTRYTDSFLLLAAIPSIREGLELVTP